MKKIKGSTLAEVMIAMLLVGLAASGIFSVLLTTQGAVSDNDIRQEMALAARRLNEELKNYNTPTTALTAGAPGLPVSPMLLPFHW